MDGYYGQDDYDAVIAFEKVNGMSRDGVVGPAVWHRLNTATIPIARCRYGTHIEVDKTRQVLFDVRDGKVARILPVSTERPGTRRPGRFTSTARSPATTRSSCTSRCTSSATSPCTDTPSVPAYPASHGCVRIPIWAAVPMYDTHGYGTTVILY